MYSCAEDSDATVAPDDQEAELSQVLDTGDENSQAMETDCSPPSPSILHPPKAVCPCPRNIIDRDIVPCSSDEGTDEILSQEYPPPTSGWQNKGRADQSQPSLSQVEKDQESLMSKITVVLANYGEILPSNFVNNAKEKLSAIEGQLKTISQTHQAERKQLVMVHTQLSQESSQEGPASGESGSLRSQLLSLSTRQKKLLECFKKQKEISLKVGELIEREAKAKRTVESSRSSHEKTVILPNLVKHLASHSQQPRSNPSTTTTVCSVTSITTREIPTTSTPNPALSQNTIPQALSQSTIPCALSVRQCGAQANTSTVCSFTSNNTTRATLTSSTSNPALSQSNIQTTGSSANVKALGSELTQPVPLSTLTHHDLLIPGSVLTCTILDLPDLGGRLPFISCPSNGCRAAGPDLAIVTKRLPRNKLTTQYLSHKKSSGTQPLPAVNNTSGKQSATSAVVNSIPEKSTSTNAPPVPHPPSQPKPFNPDALLTSCEVLLVSDDYQSLRLPANFWEESKGSFSPIVMQQIEMNLN